MHLQPYLSWPLLNELRLQLAQHVFVILTRSPADGDGAHLEETAVEVAKCRGKSVERISEVYKAD